jgi:sulfite exporter TauE/SafE
MSVDMPFLNTWILLTSEQPLQATEGKFLAFPFLRSCLAPLPLKQSISPLISSSPSRQHLERLFHCHAFYSLQRIFSHTYSSSRQQAIPSFLSFTHVLLLFLSFSKQSIFPSSLQHTFSRARLPRLSFPSLMPCSLSSLHLRSRAFPSVRVCSTHSLMPCFSYVYAISSTSFLHGIICVLSFPFSYALFPSLSIFVQFPFAHVLVPFSSTVTNNRFNAFQKQTR